MLVIRNSIHKNQTYALNLDEWKLEIDPDVSIHCQVPLSSRVELCHYLMITEIDGSSVVNVANNNSKEYLPLVDIRGIHGSLTNKSAHAKGDLSC